jgi:hypothetical protein
MEEDRPHLMRMAETQFYREQLESDRTGPSAPGSQPRGSRSSFWQRAKAIPWLLAIPFEDRRLGTSTIGLPLLNAHCLERGATQKWMLDRFIINL